MSTQHYAIKCTQCGAPLKILGGGRVTTVTCRYCHSLLDLNDHYKVLAKFNALKRPELPFSIGMHGKIKGVEWIIIGLIQYRSDTPSEAPWSEFLLYSPTHGYSWLVYEEGRLSFSRRIRDFDLVSWIANKPKSLFYRKAHYLQKEAYYFSYVAYVEGELTWIAKQNDRFVVWDYSGVQFQELSIEENQGELEVYHSQKLNPSEIYLAFGITQENQTPPSLHKSETTASQETAQVVSPFYRNAIFLLFALVVLTVFSSFFYQHTLLHTSFTKNYEKTLTIHTNAFLTAIHLSGYKGHHEALNVSISKGDKLYFSMNPHQARFPDHQIKPSWTATSLSATAYVKLPKGSYRIRVTKSNPNNQVTLTVTEHSIRLTYLLKLLGLFLMVGILYLFLKKGKRKRYG